MASGKMAAGTSSPVSVISRAIGPTTSRTQTTLLFCHATGFVKEMWHPTLDELTNRLPEEAGYDCKLLDFSGHGDSRKRALNLPRPLDWSNFCPGDIIEALGSGQKQCTIGIGHSMGGAALVHTELAHPGTFECLVLLEPILRPPGDRPPESRMSLAKNAARRRASWPNKKEAHQSLANRGMFKTFDSRTFDHYISSGLYEDGSGSHLKCAPEFESEVYSGVGPSVWHRLGEINCPVYVVVGGTSIHMQGWEYSSTQKFYAALATHFRKAEVRVMEGLGHFASFESPGRFADIIVDVLTEGRSEQLSAAIHSRL